MPDDTRTDEQKFEDGLRAQLESGTLPHYIVETFKLATEDTPANRAFQAEMGAIAKEMLGPDYDPAKHNFRFYISDEIGLNALALKDGNPPIVVVGRELLETLKPDNLRVIARVRGIPEANVDAFVKNGGGMLKGIIGHEVKHILLKSEKNSGAEELTADGWAVQRLNKLGYRKESLQEFFRYVCPPEKEAASLSELVRKYADVHPSNTLRIRAMDFGLVAMRSGGHIQQENKQEKVIEPFALKDDLSKAVDDVPRYSSYIDELLERRGYAQKTISQKLDILHDIIRDELPTWEQFEHKPRLTDLTRRVDELQASKASYAADSPEKQKINAIVDTLVRLPYGHREQGAAVYQHLHDTWYGDEEKVAKAVQSYRYKYKPLGGYEELHKAAADFISADSYEKAVAAAGKIDELSSRGYFRDEFTSDVKFDLPKFGLPTLKGVLQAEARIHDEARMPGADLQAVEREHGIKPSWDNHVNWAVDHQNDLLRSTLENLGINKSVAPKLDQWPGATEWSIGLSKPECLDSAVPDSFWDGKYRQPNHTLNYGDTGGVNQLNMTPEGIIVGWKSETISTEYQPEALGLTQEDFNAHKQRNIDMRNQRSTDGVRNANWSLIETGDAENFKTFLSDNIAALKPDLINNSPPTSFEIEFVERTRKALAEHATNDAFVAEVRKFFVGDEEWHGSYSNRHTVPYMISTTESPKINKSTSLNPDQPYLQFVLQDEFNLFTKEEKIAFLANAEGIDNIDAPRYGAYDLRKLCDYQKPTNTTELFAVIDKMNTTYEQTPLGRQDYHTTSYAKMLARLETIEFLKEHPDAYIKPAQMEILNHAVNEYQIIEDTLNTRYSEAIQQHVARNSQHELSNLSAGELIHAYTVHSSTSFFENNVAIRSDYEARIKVLVDAEQDPAQKRKLTEALLFNEDTEILPKKYFDKKIATYGAPELERLLVRKKFVQDPGFREWAVDSWVQSTAAMQGVDPAPAAPESAAWVARAKETIDQIKERTEGTTQYELLKKYTNEVEAQKEVAFYAKPKIQDILSASSKHQIEEAVGKAFLDHLSADPELREMTLEFLKQPLTPESAKTLAKAAEASYDRIRRNGEYDKVFGGVLRKADIYKNYANPELAAAAASSLHRNFSASHAMARAAYMELILFPVGENPKYLQTTGSAIVPHLRGMTFKRAYGGNIEISGGQEQFSLSHLQTALGEAGIDSVQIGRTNGPVASIDETKAATLFKIINRVTGEKIDMEAISKPEGHTFAADLAQPTVKDFNPMQATRQQVFDIILPGSSNETVIARDILGVYLNSLPEYEQRFRLAMAMVSHEGSAAGAAADPKIIMGQTLKNILQASPNPLHVKLGQALDSNGPEWLRMPGMKSKANIPDRWDAIELYERSASARVKETTMRVGPTLGGGAYGVTVALDKDPSKMLQAGYDQALGHTAYTMKRENVENQVGLEAGVIEKTLDEIIQRHPQLERGRSILTQALHASVIEMDFDIAARQVEIAKRHHGLKITYGKDTLVFEEAFILDHNDKGKEAVLAPGTHFNDLPLAERQRFAPHYFTAELYEIMKCEELDCDRHGAQSKKSGKKVMRFDRGAMSVDREVEEVLPSGEVRRTFISGKPTTEEKLLLGRIIGEAINDHYSNSTPLPDALSRAVHAHTDADGNLNHYIASCERAVANLGDYYKNGLMTPDQMKQAFISILKSDRVDPHLMKGARKALSPEATHWLRSEALKDTVKILGDKFTIQDPSPSWHAVDHAMAAPTSAASLQEAKAAGILLRALGIDDPVRGMAALDGKPLKISVKNNQRLTEITSANRALGSPLEITREGDTVMISVKSSGDAQEAQATRASQIQQLLDNSPDFKPNAFVKQASDSARDAHVQFQQMRDFFTDAREGKIDPSQLPAGTEAEPTGLQKYLADANEARLAKQRADIAQGGGDNDAYAREMRVVAERQSSMTDFESQTTRQYQAQMAEHQTTMAEHVSSTRGSLLLNLKQTGEGILGVIKILRNPAAQEAAHFSKQELVELGIVGTNTAMGGVGAVVDWVTMYNPTSKLGIQSGTYISGIGAGISAYNLGKDIYNASTSEEPITFYKEGRAIMMDTANLTTSTVGVVGSVMAWRGMAAGSKLISGSAASGGVLAVGQGAAMLIEGYTENALATSAINEQTHSAVVSSVRGGNTTDMYMDIPGLKPRAAEYQALPGVLGQMNDETAIIRVPNANKPGDTTTDYVDLRELNHPAQLRDTIASQSISNRKEAEKIRQENFSGMFTNEALNSTIIGQYVVVPGERLISGRDLNREIDTLRDRMSNATRTATEGSKAITELSGDLGKGRRNYQERFEDYKRLKKLLEQEPNPDGWGGKYDDQMKALEHLREIRIAINDPKGQAYVRAETLGMEQDSPQMAKFQTDMQRAAQEDAARTKHAAELVQARDLVGFQKFMGYSDVDWKKKDATTGKSPEQVVIERYNNGSIMSLVRSRVQATSATRGIVAEHLAKHTFAAEMANVEKMSPKQKEEYFARNREFIQKAELGKRSDLSLVALSTDEKDYLSKKMAFAPIAFEEQTRKENKKHQQQLAQLESHNADQRKIIQSMADGHMALTGHAPKDAPGVDDATRKMLDDKGPAAERQKPLHDLMAERAKELEQLKTQAKAGADPGLKARIAAKAASLSALYEKQLGDRVALQAEALEKLEKQAKTDNDPELKAKIEINKAILCERKIQYESFELNAMNARQQNYAVQYAAARQEYRDTTAKIFETAGKIKLTESLDPATQQGADALAKETKERVKQFAELAEKYKAGQHVEVSAMQAAETVMLTSQRKLATAYMGAVKTKSNAPESRQDYLRKLALQAFDKDKSGGISGEEFQEAARKLSDKESQYIVQALGVSNGDVNELRKKFQELNISMDNTQYTGGAASTIALAKIKLLTQRFQG